MIPDRQAEAPLVRVSGLTKSFVVQRGWKDLFRRPAGRDRRIALNDVSFDVNPGEFFGLLGHNGAGKTTLFKILATLILTDEGSAHVDGFEVSEAPSEVRRRLVPVIPSERSLYWRVSAQENLRLYASLHGLKGSKAMDRVSEALEIVDLVSAGDKQVGLFSSGMKQRLLIARALLGRPRVLLLDEPTRSLDPISARDFRAFLRTRIGAEFGTTVLLATHDHEEVTELCDRVAVLHEGRMVAVGETNELLTGEGERVLEVWTSSPNHPALQNAIETLGGRRLSEDDDEVDVGPWRRVRVLITATEAEASELLSEIVGAGVPISRFAWGELSLADLLERVAPSEARVPTVRGRKPE